MSTTNNKNPWNNINLPASGNVAVLRVDAEHPYNIYYAKDARNNYMLFFIVKDFPKYRKTIDLNGIDVSFNDINDQHVIVLSLKSNTDWKMFLHICIDLNDIAKDGSTEQDAVRRFYNRLLYWQYFMKNGRQNKLTKEEQHGLIGELLFIERNLIGKYEALEIMNFWTGPDGDVQDFSIGDKRVEIKTCSSPAKNEVKISSAQQLYSENNKVFLSVFYLAPASSENTDALTLYGLAKRLSEKLHDNVVAYETFIQKLASIGMFLGEAYYNEEYVVCNNIKYFTVTKDFPKITPNMLVPAINKVVYTVNLNMCSQYETEQDEVI